MQLIKILTKQLSGNIGLDKSNGTEFIPRFSISTNRKNNLTPKEMQMNTACILVVEDEGITAKDIEKLLQELGYNVPAIASSGEEAVAFSKKFKPDLILIN